MKARVRVEEPEMKQAIANHMAGHFGKAVSPDKVTLYRFEAGPDPRERSYSYAEVEVEL